MQVLISNNLMNFLCSFLSQFLPISSGRYTSRPFSCCWLRSLGLVLGRGGGTGASCVQVLLNTVLNTGNSRSVYKMCAETTQIIRTRSLVTMCRT